MVPTRRPLGGAEKWRGEWGWWPQVMEPKRYHQREMEQRQMLAMPRPGPG